MKNIVLILSVTLLVSCSLQKIDKNRNKLEFVSPLKDVRDSINCVINIMEKVSKSENYFKSQYYIYNNKLVMNDKKIGDIDSLQVIIDSGKYKPMYNFNATEFKRFLMLIIYLRNNKITSATKSPGFDQYYLQYKSFERGGLFTSDEKYVRQIMLVKNITDTTDIYFKNYEKIYDKKGDMILFGIK